MSMTLIQHIELGSNQSSITFSSIPATFTDLYLLVSVRSTINATNDAGYLVFNSDTNSSNYSFRQLRGDGSNAFSNSGTFGGAFALRSSGNTATSNTFGNNGVYIPNYRVSAAKSVSADSVSENNASSVGMSLWASLWTGTAAITSIQLRPETGDWVTGSSATLYGITAGSSGGVTVS
jgi:hypothetical protein